MSQRINRNLPLAVSLLALVVALGTTSYAAIALPRNSVGSAQIRSRAVGTSELAPDGVSAAKVRNRSLRAEDFAFGQLPTGATGANGETGLPGAAGPAGPAGPAGSQGPAGVLGAITVQREDVPVPDASTIATTVTCPAGTRVIGGGSAVDPPESDDVHVAVSRPFRTTAGAAGDDPVDGETFDGWRVIVRNPGAGTLAATLHAYAVCAHA